MESKSEIWLGRLLALMGAVLIVAFIPMLFPISWMDWIHQQLGLGELPEGPIVAYLARSTSMMYGVHGCLMFLVGWKVQKYWSLVPVFGGLHVLVGAVVLWIDLTSPMPFYWTAVEGVPIMLAGILIFVWWKAADRKRNEPV